jgi:peptide/nickel transport system substrate-binding protein
MTQEQEFFASFFQKGSAFLWCFDCLGLTRPVTDIRRAAAQEFDHEGTKHTKDFARRRELSFPSSCILPVLRGFVVKFLAPTARTNACVWAAGRLGRVWAVAFLLALPAAAFAQKTTLSVGLLLEPPVLDPTVNPADPIRSITNGNVFEGLTWINEAGRVEPRLATGWTVSADGLTYRFHLRDHVRFHDGTAFDCSIVRYAYQRAAAPDSVNPEKSFFTAMRQIDCPAPREAVITLNQPVGNLPYELAWAEAAMVAPNTAATNATHPVGTGPYAFASWRRGDNVTLVRNESYWGATPQIKTVTFRFVSDALAASNALISGDLDAYPAFFSNDLLPRLRAQPNLKVETGTFPIKILLALNEAKKPLDDIRVRRALAYAIDRDGILQAFAEPGSTIIGSHMSPSDPDYVDLSKRYPYDPARARALLAAAGVKPGFSLAIAIPSTAYSGKVGELIAAYLSEVGINANLQPIAWPQWLSQVYTQGAYEATIIGHIEPNDLDIYARPHYYFNYHDAAYNALFSRYQMEGDPAKRHSLSVALQQKLADDEPNVFLFSAPHVCVWNAKLQGMWVNQPISAIPVAGAYWKK